MNKKKIKDAFYFCFFVVFLFTKSPQYLTECDVNFMKINLTPTHIYNLTKTKISVVQAEDVVSSAKAVLSHETF